MKRLILILQMTLFLSNGYTQTPFDTIPIKIFYFMKTNDIGGGISYSKFSETINQEVCFKGVKYKKHDLDFNVSTYNSIYYRYDSIQKKIVYREGGSGNSYKEYELFNFKHKIGDYNINGYKLDSIDSVFIYNRNYKLFFFSSTSYKKDVWLENFGSISNWFFSEMYKIRDISDGAATITIDSIYFGNKYVFRMSDNFKKFDTIDSSFMDIYEYRRFTWYPFVKTSDTCGINGNYGQKQILDSCLYDSDYMTNFNFVLDPNGLKCGDSAKLDISPKYENKIVNWINLKTQKIEYPDTFSKKGREMIFDVEVMNKDSSCKLRQKYSVNTNCTYCNNPKNNYKLSLSIDNDSLFCDTVVKLSSNIKAGDTFLYKYSPSFSQLILKDTNTYRLTFNISNGKCISIDTTIDFKYYCKSNSIESSKNDNEFEVVKNKHSILIQFKKLSRFSIEIFDIMGRIIDFNTYISNDYEFFYDKLSRGVYFLRIENNNIIKHEKIVISQ